MDLQLWLAFAMGVIIRWGDRLQFVVSEAHERSISGYFKHNWGRLIVRSLATPYLFYLLIDEGLVTNRLIAVSIGISADVLIESFLDRAKRLSEGVIQKLGNGGANGKP